MKTGIWNKVAGALAACAALSLPLLAAAQSPASAETNSLGRLFNPKSFVYVLTNPTGPNSVEAFARNRVTGKLSYQGRYSTGGLGDFHEGAFEQHGLVSDGKFLYAINPASDDISVFDIRRDGSLRLVSRTPSGGANPVSIAVHGQLLYVANQGDPLLEPDDAPGPRIPNYSGFRINFDGTLKPIPGSTVTLNPGDTPTDILFNKAGNLLVGARLMGRIVDSFKVGLDGRLSRAGALNVLGPFGLSFNPVKDDHLVSATFFLPGASSYDVSRRGTLRVISDIVDPPGIDNCWTAFTPDGEFVWTSSFIPGILSLFHVERDGSLQFVSTHTPTDGATSSDIVVDSTGRFMYALRPFPTDKTKIQVKRITKTPQINGGLQDIQDIALPSAIGADGLDTRAPIGLVIVDNPGTLFSTAR